MCEKKRKKKGFNFVMNILKGMSEEQYLTEEDFIYKEGKATSD